MVLLRFFIGATDPSIVEQLAKEQRKFGDLVFYDLPDEYENLHLKIHVVFQWQQEFCAQAKFLLKTDDDTNRSHSAPTASHREAIQACDERHKSHFRIPLDLRTRGAIWKWYIFEHRCLQVQLVI
ncbi:Beta-1,3-galactosyltransferase 1 [Aphelenchoides avenae]|nr:Beta-1,3-galactosyltransferase 1 [Aphelenchus avenae]